jgi:hypothetical protein
MAARRCRAKGRRGKCAEENGGSGLLWQNRLTPGLRVVTSSNYRYSPLECRVLHRVVLA